MKTYRGMIAALVGSLMATLGAEAQTDRYVVPPGTPGVVPGGGYTSWGTAATNIADAVGACSSTEQDTVSISNGTYALSGYVFVGKPATLQAFGGEVVVDGNQAERCFWLSHAGAVLSGLTISNGLTLGNGGGVYIDANGGSVVDCTVVDNEGGAGYSGGGVYIASAAGSVTGGEILDNRCGRSGGGLMLIGGMASNVVIVGNAATNTGGPSRRGGGAYVEGGGTLIASSISNNWTTYFAGGVCADASWIVDCIIATNTSDYGAGMELFADAVVTNCVVSNNIAAGGGGGFWVTAAATITDSTICHNYGPNEGGGIYLRNGRLVNSTIGPNTRGGRGGGVNVGAGALVSNCVIIGNESISADGGGGCYFWPTALPDPLLCDSTIVSNSAPLGPGGGAHMRVGGIVRNCLFTHNDATNTIGGGNLKGVGGAIFADANTRGGLIESCTIAGNTAHKGGGVCFQSIGNAMTNCVVYGNTANWYFTTDNIFFKSTGDSNGADTNAPAYSCFTADLAPPGGKGNLVGTNPLYQDASAGNYRLDKNSPCIDQGFNRGWMGGAVDLRELPRIAGSTVDMGAYEHHPTGTMITIQ